MSISEKIIQKMSDSPKNGLKRSFTVGYSDSEDRVWVRLVGKNFEQRLWLTRRCVLALIKALASALEASLVELDSMLQMGSAQRLAMEQEEANKTMGEQGPAPSVASKGFELIEGGLCTLFDLQVVEARWVVRLHSVSGQPLVFDGNRLQMHQLLKSLLNRQTEADWGFDSLDWAACSPAL